MAFTIVPGAQLAYLAVQNARGTVAEQLVDARRLLEQWLVDLETGTLFYGKLLVEQTTSDSSHIHLKGVTLDGQPHVGQKVATLDKLSQIILNAVFKK